MEGQWPKTAMEHGAGGKRDSAGLANKPNCQSDLKPSKYRCAVAGVNGMEVEVVLQDWEMNTEALKRKVEDELEKRLSREDSAKLWDTTIDLLVDGRLCKECTLLASMDGICISFVRRMATEEEYNKKCEEALFKSFLADHGLTEEQFNSVDDHEIDSLVGPF